MIFIFFNNQQTAINGPHWIDLVSCIRLITVKARSVLHYTSTQWHGQALASSYAQKV